MPAITPKPFVNLNRAALIASTAPRFGAASAAEIELGSGSNTDEEQITVRINDLSAYPALADCVNRNNEFVVSFYDESRVGKMPFARAYEPGRAKAYFWNQNEKTGLPGGAYFSPFSGRQTVELLKLLDTVPNATKNPVPAHELATLKQGLIETLAMNYDKLAAAKKQANS